MTYQADIGVFGGTGLYELFPAVHEEWINTPYGPPSDRITISEIEGKRVALLPRHGAAHHLPPHMINYRANLWAMKALGVTRIIGPCAAGSLKAHIRPGDFVVTDQFVNRTWGRRDTFFDGPITTHVSAADPYCPQLRRHAIEQGKILGLPLHESGTVVVIQGPRFSSRAESREYQSHGWEVINMTQYPENILARELGICYVNIALITDYDAGLAGDPCVEAVSHGQVLQVFQENSERLKTLLHRIIVALPLTRDDACTCADTLDEARA